MAGWKKEKEKGKKKKGAEQPAAEPVSERLSEREGKIAVKICGRDKGLEEYEGVKFVRVVSRRYNLLIMADYLPLIGELEGSVSFRTAEREYSREHLKGYFMHKQNRFSLMLESEGESGEADGRKTMPEAEGKETVSETPAEEREAAT